MKSIAKRLVPSPLKPLLRRAYDSANARAHRRQVNRALAASESRGPHQLFCGLDDEAWFWANTAGRREDARLAEILPGLPDEQTQVNFTGASGDATLREAFQAYGLFKSEFEKHSKPLSECENILDYGCGWGRIIRFFMRDVPAERLWGADCFAEVLDISRATNRWCNFELVNPLPPTRFPDAMFDFIYSFSVFSHLSEEAHLRWLEEFARILKPGGILVATTRKREFIELCQRLREMSSGSASDLPLPQQGLLATFPDAEKSMADYDAGRFCYHPTGGGGPLDSSFFGETCIPKGYVLNRWTEAFDFLDFIDDERCLQSVIVVRNR